MTNETRNPNPRTTQGVSLQSLFSDFGIRVSFGFRPSSFVIHFVTRIRIEGWNVVAQTRAVRPSFAREFSRQDHSLAEVDRMEGSLSGQRQKIGGHQRLFRPAAPWPCDLSRDGA